MDLEIACLWDLVISWGGFILYLDLEINEIDCLFDFEGWDGTCQWTK